MGLPIVHHILYWDSLIPHSSFGGGMRTISNSKLGTDGKATQLISYNLLPKKLSINIDIHKKYQ